MTIQDATFQLLKKLRTIYSENEASEITDLVMEFLTGSKKAERMIYKNEAITNDEEARLMEIIEKLINNQPVQYVLGEAWFFGMKFKVNNSVLIPRPETEELVDWVIKEIKANYLTGKKHYSIIDIGTGSGCIPITLKKKIPVLEVTAIDVCSEAIYVAAENATELETEIEFILMDFLDNKTWNSLKKFDIIISNPPYIRHSESEHMHRRVKDHEPHLALFVPNNDALIFYRNLADFAAEHLKMGGCIFTEINEALGNEVSVLFESKGLGKIEIRKDMQGKNRMIKAQN